MAIEHKEGRDKTDWLVIFRRAKCLDTLDMMRDAAIEKVGKNPKEVAEIIRGHARREDEIEAGQHVKKWGF